MNELTWEQEQDINEYLAWKIDNDWATKGHAVMPQTMVKETEVYTIEELEAIGWSVHETALQNVREWNWECWEPSQFTDDIKTWLPEEWPLFDLQDSTLEWSTNPNWIRGKGSIDLVAYMRHFKLCNKYRALWYALTELRLESYASVSFGFGASTSLDDLEREIDYDIDGLEHDSPRYVKLMDQLTALERDIDNYMDDIETRLLKNLRAEQDYQYSDEYAKETIEAYELRFTEDGEIYH